MAKRKGGRSARVVVPVEYVPTVPEEIDVPEPYQELPEPHVIEMATYTTWRNNYSSHQRVKIPDVYDPADYVTLRVIIPNTKRDIKPQLATYAYQANAWVITLHNQPDRKLDRDMNRRHRDWKHQNRDDPDDSRSDALHNVPRHAQSGRFMLGALHSNDPKIVADTAILAHTMLGK